MARRDTGTGVLSGGEGDLKAVLEGSGRTRASKEGRVEVAEVVEIGEGIDFALRVADCAEPCFDGRGKACPAGEPAVGTSDRDGERGCGLGGVAAGCCGQGADEDEQLGGGQRGPGDNLVSMDRESAPRSRNSSSGRSRAGAACGTWSWHWRGDARGRQPFRRADKGHSPQRVPQIQLPLFPAASTATRVYHGGCSRHWSSVSGMDSVICPSSCLIAEAQTELSGPVRYSTIPPGVKRLNSLGSSGNAFASRSNTAGSSGEAGGGVVVGAFFFHGQHGLRRDAQVFVG